MGYCCLFLNVCLIIDIQAVEMGAYPIQPLVILLGIFTDLITWLVYYWLFSLVYYLVDLSSFTDWYNLFIAFIEWHNLSPSQNHVAYLTYTQNDIIINFLTFFSEINLEKTAMSNTQTATGFCSHSLVMSVQTHFKAIYNWIMFTECFCKEFHHLLTAVGIIELMQTILSFSCIVYATSGLHT